MSDGLVPQNAPTVNLPFEVAFRAMKNGSKISRDGWGRVGMYLYYVPAQSYPAVTKIAKDEFGEMVPYGAYIAMKTHENVVPWNPSQTCMCSDDWQIVD